MSALRAFPNVCVLRPFSKAHGLAGLRVGYAIARPPVADAVRRTVLPFAVTNLAQSAAIASLDAADELERRVRAVVQERERMTVRLRALGWHLTDSRANFVWIRMTDPERELMLDALADADILARGFAGDGVRITVADAAANDRVVAVLERLATARQASAHA